MGNEGTGQGDVAARDARFVDRLIAGFEERNHAALNRVSIAISVPLLLWSGFALLKVLPEPRWIAAVPLVGFPGIAAVVVSLAYALLSWRIGAVMLAVCAVLVALASWNAGDEALPLWQPALVFLALGLTLWLVGRRIEGRPARIGAILADLLMGPVWLIARILQFVRIGY